MALLSAEIGSYKNNTQVKIVTDITSISILIYILIKTTATTLNYTWIAGPTVSNSLCNIPYNYANQEQYFCFDDLFNSRYICLDKNGTVNQCKLGKFKNMYNNSQ